MKKEYKVYLVCNGCDKELELDIKKSPLEQALENGWYLISVKQKDERVAFFVCDKCIFKFLKD